MKAPLPHLSDRLYLTDGGLETSLIYLDGLTLPYFAAFHLLRDPEGRKAIERYYERFAAMAVGYGTGFVLESPTWRANADWGAKLGYTAEDLAAVNREGIAMMVGIRRRYATPATPAVISGCIGPRGDGYRPEEIMTADEAEAYHAVQVGVLSATAADVISAFTMTNTPEAIGIARAARAMAMPVVISFTLETDGRLPTGETLPDAIAAVDAATNAAPAYYMINCAHPSHFAHLLVEPQAWHRRLAGIRANASTRSHAELDQATDLDAGDPVALGRAYADLRHQHSGLRVLGGCCGTDHRHIDQIGRACVPSCLAA
jgi:S-methylmethionine-dependent homocysteine/selenocysteine methylase